MSSLKELYEERKFNELEAAVKGQDADFESCMYLCFAEAGKHHPAVPSLDKAKEAFDKAKALAGNEEQKLQLVKGYVKELQGAVDKNEEFIGKTALMKDMVISYRDSMEQASDGFIAAAEEVKVSDRELALTAGKCAAHCLCEVALVRDYDNDNGKAVTHAIDNIKPERRALVLPKYDAIVGLCKEIDPDYVPEEIQREHVVPGLKEKESQEAADKAAGKKKSFLDKLLDLF